MVVLKVIWMMMMISSTNYLELVIVVMVGRRHRSIDKVPAAMDKVAAVGC